MGREVEADNLFASQGISSSDLSQLGTLLQSFSIDQIHCDFDTLQQNYKCNAMSKDVILYVTNYFVPVLRITP